MKSTLKALAQLILQNVDVLDASIQTSGGKEPSLNDPYNPKTDYPYHDPAVLRASDVISAAAVQLLQTVRSPQMCLISESVMHAVPAAIHAASELHVPEILREAGPKGLHVTEIAEICKIEASKLSLILRVLASRLIFREVRPDVFANNKLSSVLDKGRTVEELQKPNTPKFDDPKAALAAFLNHLGDEGLKCSAYLCEAMSDPEFAMSGEPNRSALNKAFNYDKPLWEFYEEPSQKERLYRFGVAMEGIQALEPPDLAYNGDAFTWEALPKNALVVDVGGGIGSVSIQVAEKYPKLKFVVQDRAPVIADGIKRCDQLKKDLLTSGRIIFEEHDFFAPQPRKNASVFLMKHILHDWSDVYAKTILRQLREAASPETKLFVLEKVPPYTCPVSLENSDIEVPGYLPYEVPAPLLAVGSGDPFPYIQGLMMMQFFNGQERTIGHYVELFREAGWKIEKLFQLDPLSRCPSQIRAVPM